ncbi:MAG TPA: DUF1616 domain-containing protein [Methanobacteriaceae archaeon]|nr:DUF1616 domain-containing protein [Methanobacteriaceae archaeon]
MEWDRKLSQVIIVFIALGIVLVAYIAANPISEKYTEFYVLGADGKAGNYPANLTINETGNVTLGIVNHESQTVNYSVLLKVDNVTFWNENFTLYDGQKKEIPLSFMFKEREFVNSNRGNNLSKNLIFPVSQKGQQKIEMFLYKLPDTQNIYRELFLNVSVK